jgi:hypothetical protein
VVVLQIVQGNWILNLIDGEDLVCQVIALPIFMSRVELSISDASSSSGKSSGFRVLAGRLSQTYSMLDWDAVE